MAKIATVETVKRDFTKTAFIVSTLILLISLAGVSYYFYHKYQTLKQASPVKQGVEKNEMQLLTEKIGTIIVLPEGENPTIYTISDISKVKDKVFFSKAKNGDVVLLYMQAKKAILYDPKINKIVEVAPLVVPSDAVPTPELKTEVNSSLSVTPIVAVVKNTKISIYNGTKTASLAAEGEKKISSTIRNITVVEKDDSIKDYAKTIVIDVYGENNDLAKQIATLMDGTVEKLPLGEKPPKGELLVIMGGN